jgi:hypothetical protein
VFFSGTLHGNERVGPTVTAEFAEWLLEMYSRDHWARLLVDTRQIIIVPAGDFSFSFSFFLFFFFSMSACRHARDPIRAGGAYGLY